MREPAVLGRAVREAHAGEFVAVAGPQHGPGAGCSARSGRTRRPGSTAAGSRSCRLRSGTLSRTRPGEDRAGSPLRAFAFRRWNQPLLRFARPGRSCAGGARAGGHRRSGGCPFPRGGTGLLRTIRFPADGRFPDCPLRTVPGAAGKPAGASASAAVAQAGDRHTEPVRPGGRARVLADIATIGILQERAIRRGELLTEQLQHALKQPGRRRTGLPVPAGWKWTLRAPQPGGRGGRSRRTESGADARRRELSAGVTRRGRETTRNGPASCTVRRRERAARTDVSARSASRRYCGFSREGRLLGKCRCRVPGPWRSDICDTEPVPTVLRSDSPIPRASVAPATASGSSMRAATSTWPSWSRRPGATRRSSGTTTASTRCGACRAGNPADRGQLRARAARCPENRAVRLISSTTIRKPAEAAVRSSGSRKGLPGRITHTTTALAESASTKPNSRAGSAHSRNTQLRSRRHSTRADTAHFGVPGFAFEAQTTVGAPRSRRAGPEETGGPNRTEHRQGPRFSADSVPAAAKNSPHSPSGSPAGPPRPVRRANPDP
ncbi:hypothetical protein SAMN05421854_10645 [Amycolatopsis rubida]|uniref:Uncharacterized protein n=1 Tax=Amycolatopsis rubida TaxID=112413 RepID=A0A1I5RRP7_9PSEU|nr:hypothetical protein SAMN05421854_10645 [Amycolatopsis rubida]